MATIAELNTQITEKCTSIASKIPTLYNTAYNSGYAKCKELADTPVTGVVSDAYEGDNILTRYGLGVYGNLIFGAANRSLQGITEPYEILGYIPEGFRPLHDYYAYGYAINTGTNGTDYYYPICAKINSDTGAIEAYIPYSMTGVVVPKWVYLTLGHRCWNTDVTY